MCSIKSLKVFCYAVVALLLSSILLPISCDAATVWSDDFNDGNYNSWTIYGLNFSTFPLTTATGEFSAADNTLKATSADPIYSYAVHSSSVVYGTWSFDLNAVDNSFHYSVVFFIAGDMSLIPTMEYAYSIIVCTDSVPTTTTAPAILLAKHGPTPGSEIIGRYEPSDGVSGWQNIVVTRSTSGLFTVYVNGTAQISVEDTTHTTSVDFCFGSETGPAIDNVVVSDTVDFPATDLTVIILFGVVGIAVVVILVIYFIRFRR